MVYIYTLEYYSAIKRDKFESVLMKWMNLEPTVQSGASQKERGKYSILMPVYGLQTGGGQQWRHRRREP